MEGAKSISKQHLTISVAEVQKGFCKKIDEYSLLTIRDLGSKFKSFITCPKEEELEVDSEYRMDGPEAVLRLGKVKHALFRIYWKPFVLALSNVKAKEVQDACDQLDIKLSKDYTDLTTHVVTGKYNTPKTLQALARQKWIVGQRYITAMLLAADELSKDMASLPDPSNIDYLPPEDAFSQEYGRDAFLPRAGREKTFDGLEFVFFDNTQYMSLSAPIFAGQGKSFQYEGIVDMQNIANYLVNLNRPVVVLTIEEETTAMLDDLVPTIGAVSLTQGDFIRVFLSDGKHEIYAAKRTKPLSVKQATEVVNSPKMLSANRAYSIQPLDNLQTQPQEIAIQPSKRIGSRPMRVLASFDDDLFGGNVGISTSQRIPKTSLKQSQARKTPNPSQDLLDADELFGSSVAHPSSHVSTMGSQKIELQNKSPDTLDSVENSQLQARAKRSHDSMAGSPGRAFKRARTQSRLLKGDDIEVEVEEEFELAPAAAEYARKKSQTQASQEVSRSTRSDTRVSPDTADHTQSIRKKRQRQQEITEKEIEEALKETKRRSEQQQQAEEEENVISSNDKLKNLGTVEFFKVVLRDSGNTPQPTKQNVSDRWNPKWTGRKNFKGFRRAVRDGSTCSPEKSAIMIRLVPSKPSDRGMADQQWLETATTRNLDSQRTPRTRNDDLATNREFSTIHVLDDNGGRSETHGVMMDSQASDSQARQGTRDHGSHTSGTKRSIGARASQSVYVPARKPQLAVGSSRRQTKNTLFMPDESDSDDDPLRFRL